MSKFADLFCGIGGFHLALAKKGYECVFASDIDRKAREAYEANFKIRPEGDITKIAAEDIPPHNVLCGGFPCQPFSLSNKTARGMDDARGTLFFDIARIAKHHQPALLLLENVPRILTFDNGKVLEVIKNTLDDIGYDLTWHKLNAADYGCATARLRVYFVGIRKDVDQVSYPPTPSDERDCIANHLRPDLDTSSLERPLEDYVFGNHKNPRCNPQGTKLLGRHKNAKRNHKVQGSRVYDIMGCLPAMLCNSWEQILVSKKMLQIGHHKKVGNKQGYRVYHPWGAGPSLTATTGGLHPGGAFPVDSKVRRLHIEEAKTIQGFPPEHVLSPGAAGYKQLGNSVIPRMVELVYDSIGPRQEFDFPEELW